MRKITRRSFLAAAAACGAAAALSACGGSSASSAAASSVVYATDAFSAGLEVVDSATAEMCGQVIYPAAVLKGEKEEAARAFLAYLETDAAMTVFERVGFSAVY